MNNARPQQQAGMTQQELRFTACDPQLNDALKTLERNRLEADDQVAPHAVPEQLFLYAAKRMTIDRSDMYDGESQNYSMFLQYRKGVEDLSSRGMKRFKLANWMRPLYMDSATDDRLLVGIGMRVEVDPYFSNKLIAPPLYGPKHYLSPLTPEQEAEKAADARLLAQARAASFIPVRYELGKPSYRAEAALEQLQSVLQLGSFVAHMTIVPSSPRSARENSVFHSEPLGPASDRFALS